MVRLASEMLEGTCQSSEALRAGAQMHSTGPTGALTEASRVEEASESRDLWRSAVEPVVAFASLAVVSASR